MLTRPEIMTKDDADIEKFLSVSFPWPSHGGQDRTRRAAACSEARMDEPRGPRLGEGEVIEEVQRAQLHHQVNNFRLFWPLEKAFLEQKVSTLNESSTIFYKSLLPRGFCVGNQVKLVSSESAVSGSYPLQAG